MAVFCICGFCIPYSVFWPLILLILKPVLEFFAKTFGWELGEMKKKNDNNPQCTSVSETSVTASVSCTSKTDTDAILPTGLFDLESEEQYAAAIKESRTTFVRFTSSWCVPCKKLVPLWTELSLADPESRFISVDVDKYEDIAAAHGVVTLPMFFSFRQNNEMDRLWGMEAKNEQALRAFVSKGMTITTKNDS